MNLKKRTLDTQSFLLLGKSYFLGFGIFLLFLILCQIYLQILIHNFEIPYPNDVLSGNTIQEFETNIQSFQEKKETLRNTQYLSFLGSFILLMLLMIFIYFPSASKVKYQISELLSQQKLAHKNLLETQEILQQKNELLGQFKLLKSAIEENLLYARIDKHGYVINCGERMNSLIQYQNNTDQRIIFDNLGLSEQKKQELLTQIQSQKSPVLNKELKCTIEGMDLEWLDISVIPIVKKPHFFEYLVICQDITSRKRIEFEKNTLYEEKVMQESLLQKTRASLIVEAQEDERKRIAKDIHDSIGQMLTALKFNIESIDLNAKDKLLENTKKLTNLKALTGEIILGVRMATFNLTPPELLDYGVVTAIQKMVTTLNAFTDTEIILTHTLDSISSLRFETFVETNLYRITQECLNNAIKYAHSTEVIVHISKTDNIFSISITDNGKGFDKDKIPSYDQRDITSGGMGLFFMKERTSFINGRIFINSKIDKGTRITLNYPIKACLN